MQTINSRRNYFISTILIISVVLAVIVFGVKKLHKCEKHYELSSTKAATCTEEGLEIYKCKKCDETKEVTIPKIDHNYLVTSTSTASCTADGIEVLTCSMCSDTKENIIATALGHDIVVVSETPATCTTDGLVVKECTRCDEHIEETITKSDHTRIVIYETPATCTTDGLTEYYCPKCEELIEVVQKATGHNYTAVLDSPATCEDRGMKTFICSTCYDRYAEYYDALGHDYKKTSDSIAATCTTEGENRYKCSRCSMVKKEYIDALGHKYDKVEIVTPASCLAYGIEKHSCSREGCTSSFSENIPKLSHNPSGEATIFEACVCTRCNTVLHPKLAYDLSINYYYGFATDYKSTFAVTQDRTMHELGKFVFYQKNNYNPLTFEESMSLHEFYTHSLLTTKEATTSDGKHYYVDGGFKVSFDFGLLEKQLYDNDGMDIVKSSDFTKQFDSDAILKIVKQVNDRNRMYNMYQVVDFSDSVIEIARLIGGEYVTVGTINTVEGWNVILNSNGVVLSDKNSKLFSEAGTYRIMFKFSTAWFIENPREGIFDENGEQIYPYGFFNDQYDYFYVTVKGDTNNTLLPDELDETKDMFYQISMDDVKDGHAFIKSGEAVEILDDIDLLLDYKIAYWDNEYHYNNKILQQWSLELHLYEKSKGEYVLNSTHDLIALLESGSNKVRTSKKVGDYMIKVSYTFKDATTGEETSYSDVYYLTIS